MRPGIWTITTGILLAVTGLQAGETDSSADGSNLSEGPFSKMTMNMWGEFYNESMVFQIEKGNVFSNSHIRQGLKINHVPGFSLIQTYAMVRYGRDLHRDFWNNKTEVGLGLRARFLKKVFLAPYIEYIQGFYNKIPEDRPRPGAKQYHDLRGGLIFWYGWDKWYSPASLVTFPRHFIGEIYSELNYFRKDRNNVILYTHVKAGVRMMRIWKSTFGI